MESLQAFRDDGEEADPPEADVYMHGLLAWVSSSNTRAGHVNHVLAEVIPAYTPGKEVPDFSDILTLAQARERDEVHAIVRSYLERQIAEQEGAE